MGGGFWSGIGGGGRVSSQTYELGLTFRELHGCIPGHELDEAGHGLELWWKAIIKTLFAQARFAERMVSGGVGGTGMDDGEEVTDCVGLLVNGLGGGVAVEL